MTFWWRNRLSLFQIICYWCKYSWFSRWSLNRLLFKSIKLKRRVFGCSWFNLVLSYDILVAFMTSFRVFRILSMNWEFSKYTFVRDWHSSVSLTWFCWNFLSLFWKEKGRFSTILEKPFIVLDFLNQVVQCVIKIWMSGLLWSVLKLSSFFFNNRNYCWLNFREMSWRRSFKSYCNFALNVGHLSFASQIRGRSDGDVRKRTSLKSLGIDSMRL